MGVPVRWVLSQPDLALELKGGAAGLGRQVTLVLATELAEPFRWLSGGELVLTTGLGIPLGRPGRHRYLRKLLDRDVAAVGFGTGLSHPQVPADLVEAADELGLPLLEVPLPTPFAAVTKKVMARLAEQQYDAVLRVSRAQPRMTRAVVQGGTRATLKELAAAISATALLLDLAGEVVQAQPRTPPAAALAQVRQLVEGGAGAARVSVLPDGSSVAVQTIAVGPVVHGYLAVVAPAPLGHVEQVLLGHANSLLALDFEKPARLRAALNELGGQALALALGDEVDRRPAWEQLRQGADAAGRVRALTVLAADPDAVLARADRALGQLGRPLFARAGDGQATIVLRGADEAAFARALVDRPGRAGLSAPFPLERLTEAVDQAALTAAAAAHGELLEFANLAGRTLLTYPQARAVLDTLGDALIGPLRQHDADNGTELLPSLRAFLEANGHWESAAAVLGVHRHTLRSRVGRIEAVLRCDLGSARVRAELLLALIARGA